MKILVTNYFDVWGNKKEGWEVNNCCHDVYNVRRFDPYNKAATLRFLKRIDFLKKSVRLASLSIEEAENALYISQSRDGCPVCAVEWGSTVDKYY